MDMTDLLSGSNMMLAGAIFVLISGIKMVAPGFFQTKAGQRLLPVLPPILGIGGAFAGFGPPGYNVQNKIMLGVIAGYVAAHSFKICKSSVLGFGLSGPPAATTPKK